MKTIKKTLLLSLIFIICITFNSCKKCESETAKNQDVVLEDNSLEILKQQQIQKEEEEKRLIEEQRVQYIDAINTLLRQDEEVSQYNNKDYILTAPAMRNLDLSNCPTDFATAYVDHIHAWEDAAKVQKAQLELKKYTDLATIAGIIATLTESEATPFSNYLQAERELKELASQTSEEISRTWKVIERIAVSYGANLPRK